MISGRRPTIVDVAREAGVSRSLVSLVLQNPAKVSDARRAAVEDAMRKLGYRPNRAARSLAQRRTDTLGVLVSDLHNPFYTEVVEGIESVARERGQRVLIATGGRDPANEKSAAETFVELRADGLVLITPRLDPGQVAEVSALVPTVVIGRPEQPAGGHSTIQIDDLVGMGLAVEHLWRLGHRRIGHISAGGGPARARDQAFREVMKRRGSKAKAVIVDAEPTELGGRLGAMTILTATPRPTAIVALNDVAALGALAAIESLGLRCPDDVSVIGYDNSIFAQLQPVLLTSVDVRRLDMGVLAARMVGELAAGGAPRVESIAPTLVARRTTAPAP